MTRLTIKVLAAVVLVTSFAVAQSSPVSTQAAADSSAWTKYLHDNSGTGFSGERLLTPLNVANLRSRPGWPVHLGGPISAQPIVVGNLVYVGSWDGYEYALCARTCTVNVGGARTPQPAGSIYWKRYLGRTKMNCPFVAPVGDKGGVASTGLVTSVAVRGHAQPVLFVGGGGNLDAHGHVVSSGFAELFALDALTGAILWETRLGQAPTHFIWSSPAFYKGSVYVGVSGFNDCPLIQGQLVQVNAATGTIQHTFNVVPAGCGGGSVWGSPVIDEAQGAVYFATGNADKCSPFGPFPQFKRGLAMLVVAGLGLLLSFVARARPLGVVAGVTIALAGLAGAAAYVVGPHFTFEEPYGTAVLKLHAADLTLAESWQLPQSEQLGDSDFGSTPTLFAGTVVPGGAVQRLLGIPNKNGTYYVFNRDRLSAGPIIRLGIASEGGCPDCGLGSISPSSFDGERLYVAGGKAVIGQVAYKGSLSAFDPNNLAHPVWRVGLASGPVLGAVTGIPGLAIVGAGSVILVVETSGGTPVFQAPSTNPATPTSTAFVSAAAVALGVLYIGDIQGNLYAYSVGGQ